MPATKLVPVSAQTVSDARALGAAIRAARRAAGITLADGAMLLNVAKQTLANLETAKQGVGLDVALRAAHEFGVLIAVAPASQREAFKRTLSLLSPAPADGDGDER